MQKQTVEDYLFMGKKIGCRFYPKWRVWRRYKFCENLGNGFRRCNKNYCPFWDEIIEVARTL